jgi:hypothetical protein
VEPQTLIWFTGILVTLLWIFTMVTGELTGNYTGAQICTPVMLIYAGFLFARGNSWGKKGDD